MNAKQLSITMIAILFMAWLSSCISQSQQEVMSPSPKYYNLCMVLDGTDAETHQNSIPIITSNDIKEFAAKLAQNNSMGTLYVGYVDSDVDNNAVAIFDWKYSYPTEPGSKPSYMKNSEYNKNKAMYDRSMKEINNKRDSLLSIFEKECSLICKSAYSSAVAKQKQGSDINGALNLSLRMLKASEQPGCRNIIVMVSDGVDNVNKPLNEIPSSTEIYIVNGNVSKHVFQTTREFVTLNQVENHLFLK